jgi:hypothetical protein
VVIEYFLCAFCVCSFEYGPAAHLTCYPVTHSNNVGAMSVPVDVAGFVVLRLTRPEDV